MMRGGRTMGMDGAQLGRAGWGFIPSFKTGRAGCVKSFTPASPFGFVAALSYCCKEESVRQAVCDPHVEWESLAASLLSSLP